MRRMSKWTIPTSQMNSSLQFVWYNFSFKNQRLKVDGAFLTMWINDPGKQGSRGQHRAHLGLKGPRWAPWWPHELCYLGHDINYCNEEFIWLVGIVHFDRHDVTQNERLVAFKENQQQFRWIITYLERRCSQQLIWRQQNGIVGSW